MQKKCLHLNYNNDKREDVCGHIHKQQIKIVS